VLTDELIAEMLRQRKAAGILNENALTEDTFDEIETDASDEGEN
jgi:ribosome maturation factor RimP